MATNNAPKYVIRECDLILNGELDQTPEQFKRWVVVQLKKLALQTAARHRELSQVRNVAKQAKRFAEGGL